MKFLLALCRLIFGITFILSGFFKLIDPVGTALIMKEYFAAFHISFLDGGAVFFGIALSTLESVLGICTLTELRVKITSTISFILISFFTVLTLYLAIFNSVKDCGCFGEAIHLTNWQTFNKNLVLLPCALLTFLWRKKRVELAPAGQEWVFIGIFTILNLAIATDAYVTIPKVNFTPYKVGTDLKALKYDEQPQYQTVFIYEKGGELEEFSLEDLPDSTWTFVDSKTDLLSGSTKTAQVDLSLRGEDGEYSTEILYKEGPLVAVSIWDPRKIKEKRWQSIRVLKENLAKEGLDLYLFSTSDVSIPEDLSTNVYTSDYKTLITLNRSNGGVVYFNDGIVAYKWSALSHETIDWGEILSMDYEEIILRKSIHGRLYGAIALVGLIFILTITKYLFRLFYKKARVTSSE